jgi:hypothetical protein
MIELKTVTAVYEDEMMANKAIMHLKTQGVVDSNISLVKAENANSSDMDMRFETESSVTKKTIKWVLIGAVTGAVVTGISILSAIGFYNTVTAAALAPSTVALIGAIAGAVGGGLIGGFIGIGIPVFEARVIEKSLKQGCAVLGVQTMPHETEVIKNIFRATDGENIFVH